MGVVSSCSGNSACHVSDTEWKLNMDPIKTKRKYIADQTLTDKCSMAELELRALLDSPIAVRYMSTHSKEENNQRLLGLWFDCREWSKLSCFRHTRLVELLDSYITLKFCVTDEMCGMVEFEYLRVLKNEFELGFTNGMDTRTMDARVDAYFLKVQAACFEQLFLFVYLPFCYTCEYRSLFRLICDPDSWVTPNSFEYGRSIAQGAFGVVVNCVKKSTGAVYAMKIQPKATLLKQYRADKRRVMTEMQAYAVCDHPYVAKLCYAMQSASLTMLVMPIAKCGDLCRSLQFTSCGYFSAERVLFYAAEIVSALLYLHNFGLIYRDLKLNNVLLNEDGHIVLADFGLLADMNGILNAQFHDNAANMSNNCYDVAQRYVRPLDPEMSANSVLTSRSIINNEPTTPTLSRSNSCLDSDGGGGLSIKPLRTKSLVGTMEYMAPEIIVMFGKRTSHKDGYTAAVDWWGLGVLIYHMSAGKVPFKRVPYKQLQAQMPTLLADNMETYSSFFRKYFGEPDYSHENLTDSASELIKSLLQINPEKRLGSGVLHELVPAHRCPVRTHSFFKDINWTDIEAKAVPPPYVPVQETVSGCMEEHARGEFPNLTSLLEHLNKREWIDDSLDCVYAPPAPSSFTHVIEEFAVSVVRSMRSRGNTMIDADSVGVGSGQTPLMKYLAARQLIEVADEDQGYFFGWNYVSRELVEAPVSPITISDVVTESCTLSGGRDRIPPELLRSVMGEEESEGS